MSQDSRATAAQVLKGGSGPQPKAGQRITVHCTGIIQSTGKKFWRSVQNQLAVTNDAML